MSRLDRITIKGFKSIRCLEDFELGSTNILIGANGAGKSNFVEIFRLLRAMIEDGFQRYISVNGGCDDFLFNGPKVTSTIDSRFDFGENFYEFQLEPTVSEKFLITKEIKGFKDSQERFSTNRSESKLSKIKNEPSKLYPSSHGVGHHLYQSISSWMIYHFHDTSKESSMRRSEITADHQALRNNAANIAPFLLNLKEIGSHAYCEIIDAVKLVTPFFDDFLLRPVTHKEKEDVKLMWTQKGSDYPMQPYHLSDGTLRFICLASALLQPQKPATIVIDEPELGLHPYAISILAELIQAASKETQVIISTQSPELVNHFPVEDIIVVNREKGASTYKRLEEKDLSAWLEDYQAGELWQKNVIAGGPVHE